MAQREKETLEQIKKTKNEAEGQRCGKFPLITTYPSNIKTRRAGNCGILAWKHKVLKLTLNSIKQNF